MGRGIFYFLLGKQHTALIGGSSPAPANNLPPTAASVLDMEMMELALKNAAAAALLGEVPVGAVVYHPVTGRILARAHNRREIDNDPAAHAELLAMSAAAKVLGDWRLNEYALAVTLEPCCMCAGMIVNARLGRVVIGARDPKAGFAGSLGAMTQDARLNHRVQPIEGVLGERSAAMLKEFFRTRRRNPDQRSLGTRDTQVRRAAN